MNKVKLNKLEGKIGLCVFAETAFVHGVVLQKIARRYGINLTMSDLTGTADKCRSLLSAARYKDIEITTEQYGSHIALDCFLVQPFQQL